MDAIFTPDRLITLIGLVISVVPLLAFRKMSRKLLGAGILALAIIFAAQSWFFLQFERSVNQARHAILGYLSKDTRTELMISRHLTNTFGPTTISAALKGLESEGIVKKRNIELVHRGPQGDLTFEFAVFCNPKAREQAGMKPSCD